MPRGQSDDESLARSILVALGVPGATRQSVAASHGVSVRTVARIRARGKNAEPSTPLVPEVISRPPGPGEKEEEPTEATVANWFTGVDSAIACGVRFLKQATERLDPSKAGDVRVVSECIVELLSDVTRAWNAGGAAGAGGNLRASVAALSDDDLVAEAQKAIQRKAV